MEGALNKKGILLKKTVMPTDTEQRIIKHIIQAKMYILAFNFGLNFKFLSVQGKFLAFNIYLLPLALL